MKIRRRLPAFDKMLHAHISLDRHQIAEAERQAAFMRKVLAEHTAACAAVNHPKKGPYTCPTCGKVDTGFIDTNSRENGYDEEEQ